MFSVYFKQAKNKQCQAGHDLDLLHFKYPNHMLPIFHTKEDHEETIKITNNCNTSKSALQTQIIRCVRMVNQMVQTVPESHIIQIQPQQGDKVLYRQERKLPAYAVKIPAMIRDLNRWIRVRCLTIKLLLCSFKSFTLFT